MPTPNENKIDEKVVPPTPSSGENGQGNPIAPVEGADGEPKDIDYKKDLEILEGDQPSVIPPKKSELDKAVFSAKSTLKRIKELGGNPADLLGEDEPGEPAPAPEADESKFATKDDIARIEIEKLTQNPDEVKVILWYVKNKGLSIKDAHLLANKGKIKNSFKEITRINNTQTSRSGGGGGQPPLENKEERMSEQQEKRLKASGLNYDPTTKAYTGKRTRVRHNGSTWIHERNVNGNWVEIPDASKFE